jgi:hypothetical protein
LIGSRPQKEDPVEDQEKRTEEELEDVEGHRGKRAVKASEEPRDEAAGDEDVEAHRGHGRRVSAADEPTDEADGDDDVEAHRRRSTL